MRSRERVHGDDINWFSGHVALHAVYRAIKSINQCSFIKRLDKTQANNLKEKTMQYGREASKLSLVCVLI